MRNYADEIEELDYVVGQWQYCEACKFIDDDRQRSTPGIPCRVCGVPSSGGIMYFPSTVHLLVDLIKEAAATEHRVELKGTKYEFHDNTHFISVLLFFCTLREALINNFLGHLYDKYAKSEAIFEQLMDDNKLYSQKQNKLFKLLTGEKWADALTALTRKSSYDYNALNDTMKQLAEKRNTFTHEGYGFHVDEEVAKNCVYAVEPLVNLYVDLQNHYVHGKRQIEVLPMLEDDELKDFETIVRDAGFDPEDFKPVTEDEPLPKAGIHGVVTNVTVLRISTEQATTYKSQHGTNWFAEFQRDLKAGEYGEP